MYTKEITFLIVLVVCLKCTAREPFQPRFGSLPFIVYYPSRYRGMCVGTLVSPMAVITAAVCVTHPTMEVADKRPINVVTGASYRHPMTGIRVQVTKVIIPKYNNYSSTAKGYLMQKSPAILLLRRRIPDVIAEIPLRALDVDYKGEEVLSLQQECLIPGWHFFYRGDKVYPVHKFLLQRNLRVQFMNIVKKKLWCDALAVKFQKALTNIGYSGLLDSKALVCVNDPDRTAQPCHGMYGAPLICSGRAVAMLMAPDAQWSNCTGYSNLVHLLSSSHIKTFMTCVSRLFAPNFRLDWTAMKESMYDDILEDQYDYVPSQYDKLDSESTSSDEY